MDILVSIVVLTYNSSETIIETLDSIYNQTYPNIELIVSDDYSKDNTCEAVQKWISSRKERFTDTRLLKANRNHGVVKNCNIGIMQARGKYVQEFSGDDILHPDAIEKKVSYAEKNKLDVLYVKTRPFGPNSKTVRSMTKRCEIGYKIIKQGYDAQWKAIVRDNFLGGPCGGFYKTEFFKKVGGYDLRYPQLEDWPFIYHYIKSGHGLVLLDEYLTDYRVSGNSLCTSYNIKFVKSSFRFFVFERMWDLLFNGDIKLMLANFEQYHKLLKKIRHSK